MWRLKRIVLYLTTISLLGLVTSQDIPQMTEAERRKFALVRIYYYHHHHRHR